MEIAGCNTERSINSMISLTIAYWTLYLRYIQVWSQALQIKITIIKKNSFNLQTDRNWTNGFQCSVQFLIGINYFTYAYNHYNDIVLFLTGRQRRAVELRGVPGSVAGSRGDVLGGPGLWHRVPLRVRPDLPLPRLDQGDLQQPQLIRTRTEN